MVDVDLLCELHNTAPTSVDGLMYRKGIEDALRHLGFVYQTDELGDITAVTIDVDGLDDIWVRYSED